MLLSKFCKSIRDLGKIKEVGLSRGASKDVKGTSRGVPVTSIGIKRAPRGVIGASIGVYFPLFKSSLRYLSNDFSHIDSSSNTPRMVDIGEKSTTFRTAQAVSYIEVPSTIASLLEGNHGSKDIFTKKGPVFSTAIIAGTMAAKRTADLIPFCHQIPLDKCHIDITLKDNIITISSEVSTQHKTGVEMEALTAASVASLTIYDMCKALSHNIIIKETRLISKKGGKSDYDETSHTSS